MLRCRSGRLGGDRRAVAMAGACGLIGGSPMKGLRSWRGVSKEELEPQNTQNTQMVYRFRTMRLISRRDLPKLSSRQSCKPVAFR